MNAKISIDRDLAVKALGMMIYRARYFRDEIARHGGTEAEKAHADSLRYGAALLFDVITSTPAAGKKFLESVFTARGINCYELSRAAAEAALLEAGV